LLLVIKHTISLMYVYTGYWQYNEISIYQPTRSEFPCTLIIRIDERGMGNGVAMGQLLQYKQRQFTSSCKPSGSTKGGTYLEPSKSLPASPCS